MKSLWIGRLLEEICRLTLKKLQIGAGKIEMKKLPRLECLLRSYGVIPTESQMGATLVIIFYLFIPPTALAQADSVTSAMKSSMKYIQIAGINTPLGTTVGTAVAKFPSCQLEQGGVPMITNLPINQSWFPPLTGYTPPFPELTPVGLNGEFFSTTWLPDGSFQPITLAVLDWNIVEDDLVLCGPGNISNEISDGQLSELQGYDFIIFKGKVLAIMTSVEVNNVTNFRTLLENMAATLPGRRGPTHYGIDPDFDVTASGQHLQAPVYVTYVDNGDLRVVIQTEGTSQNGGDTGNGKTNGNIAYVDLPLWSQYVGAVQAALASPNDSPAEAPPPSSTNDNEATPIIPTIPIQIENQSGQ